MEDIFIDYEDHYEKLFTHLLHSPSFRKMYQNRDVCWQQSGIPLIIFWISTMPEMKRNASMDGGFCTMPWRIRISMQDTGSLTFCLSTVRKFCR